MTFPTFSAAIRALEESNPHLLALPINDPLVRACFDEIERQQLERIRMAAFRRPMSVEEPLQRPLFCPIGGLHGGTLESWTDLFVHLITCQRFRTAVASGALTPQPEQRYGYDVG